MNEDKNNKIPVPPAPAPAPQSDQPSEKKVHTLYDDMDDVMHSGQTGTLAQVLKETQEKEAEAKERSLSNPRNLIFIGSGMLLILFGIGIVYFALTTDVDTTPPRIEEFRIQTIVPSTTQYGLALTGQSVFTLRSELRELFLENSTPRELQYLYFTVGTSAGNRLATVFEFFTAFEIILPGPLRQTLQDEFMIGTYRTDDTRAPYIVMHVDFFDSAFRGMQEWERTLLRDLSPLFGIPSEKLIPENFEQDFVDRVIQNVPHRVLLETSAVTTIQETDNGVAEINSRFINTQMQDILLAYSFINETTLVITTDPRVITEMRRRIRDRQLFRE